MTSGSPALLYFCSIRSDNSASHRINSRVKLDIEIVLKMPISPQAASFIAITVHALLTGVYFVSFTLCLRWLIFSDDGSTLRKAIHRPFLIITVILFAFSVTDFGLSLEYNLLPVSSTSSFENRSAIRVRNSIIELLMS